MKTRILLLEASGVFILGLGALVANFSDTQQAVNQTIVAPVESANNGAGGFPGLRPALFAAGLGEVRFENFKYKSLP